ncbi:MULTISPECIES: cell envelope integrity protein TolA [unclassified Serratia (in: enterobacteria)]|uniref:cell envelope integrity protein TolA n=1 Tax=unclassified Serratia (in: enterobacteria) TaxID=2647522 RepID=UPI003076279D
MKKLIFICCISMMLVSACSTNTRKKQLPPAAKESALLAERLQVYIRDLTEAIERKLYRLKSFEGKECDVSFSMDRNGTVINISAIEGYQPLCEAGIKAIKNAEIPAPPDDEVYKHFQRLVISFKPK